MRYIFDKCNCNYQSLISSNCSNIVSFYFSTADHILVNYKRIYPVCINHIQNYKEDISELYYKKLNIVEVNLIRILL